MSEENSHRHYWEWQSDIEEMRCVDETCKEQMAWGEVERRLNALEGFIYNPDVRYLVGRAVLLERTILDPK
ncbi:hypothetical protein LCGC14_1605910 [marine sediment metagenome]|uniref:Uncharacterized protein n=1 Tax=marine sediment metagenome TaxID=412755 RepID=A0A0F9KQH3_9ZZZZ